jgi:N-carbamoyl-L-amino-acid hydrolase
MATVNAGPALPPVNGERLRASLHAAAEIGGWRAPGVQRLALSDADRQMRDTFCEWCRDCGLTVTIDRVGNIFARRDGTEDLPPVMAGSHLDTQVAGGRYDGALGVLAALETVRWLDDHELTTRRPVEVVAWSNEEGARFLPPMLGSGAFTGSLALADALDATDDEGLAFGSELARIGYTGDAPVPGTPPSAYLELHIEQGDVLHRRGLDLGIVTSAFAVRGTVLRLTGETAHAGATPMRRRRDAVVGAAEIVTALDAIGSGDGDDARSTATRLEVWPNRPGIVAGEVVLTLDYRHARHGELAQMSRELEAIIDAVCERRGLSARHEAVWDFGSEITFDAELATFARGAADRLGVQAIDMQSVAGHDAYRLASVAPTLILFVPCVDGITHNEHEEIEFDRALRGANVLAASVLEAANR